MQELGGGRIRQLLGLLDASRTNQVVIKHLLNRAHSKWVEAGPERPVIAKQIDKKQSSSSFTKWWLISTLKLV